MNKFIFDVDGTLTPSRQNMNAEFQRWFLEFCYDYDVFLITGSDYPKTIEQVGHSICENVTRVYNCNGNDVWEGGINVNTNDWVLPEEPHNWLARKLAESGFPKRTGLHFEHRPGMVNFSIVGRNANKEERRQYIKWDTENNERLTISSMFNDIFLDLQATVGGETGIDIAPRGYDKSQIIQDFNKDDNLVFFGDKIITNGNDLPLANAITNYKLGVSHQVTGWQDTWKKLNAYITNRP